VAEVLAEFAELISTTDGATYRAQACGTPNPQGLWEAWIEFIPTSGGKPVRSPRETTQPNRTDAEYWSTGLTAVYLEGALARALDGGTRTRRMAARATFDRPAPRASTPRAPRVEYEAVLDPFSVYQKGELILRRELGALSAWHLVNILLAYELSHEPAAVLNAMPPSALIDLIVASVRRHVLTP
jgi:hypothetical protein